MFLTSVLICSWMYTFSETLLLPPLSSSGAIQGRVPRTPPETKVFRLIFDKPKSATWKGVIIQVKYSMNKTMVFQIWYTSDKHCWKKYPSQDNFSNIDNKTKPCKWAGKGLSSWPVNCHISNQNAQYFLNASTPFQRLHPWQWWVSFDDQDACK